MRPSIVSVTLLSPALALVTPATEDSTLPKRFEVAGASATKGFTIPEGTPDGVYGVAIGPDGVAHHTRIETPGDGGQSAAFIPGGAPATNANTAASAAAGLVERQNSWHVTCAGYPLDRTLCDTIVSLFKWGCGSGSNVAPGQHLYTLVNGMVAYFCNIGGSATYICTDSIIGDQLQGSVSSVCGQYMAGWSNWGSEVSIGYEYVNSNWYFCGTNHR